MFQVNEANNISPGTITLSFNKNKDQQYNKRKDRETTREFRRNRLSLKKARSQHTLHAEVVEGATYKSGIQYQHENNDDLTPIPKACYAPIPSPVGLNISKQNSTVVVFDLETSNLGKY